MTDSSAPETKPPPSSFREIVDSPPVLEALERLGISTPTPVQAASLPLSLAGRDLIVQAKTGSGKTIAFAIPLLAAVRANEGRDGTLAIVLTPTRELANQIRSVIGDLAPDIRPACLIGGISIRDQLRDLERDRRIVVGTPGRVLDLLRQRELILRTVKFFTVDEVDEMFSMDFEQDVRAILERIPPERQGMFVSATVTPRVEMLARSFLQSPERIVIDTPGEERAPIEHRVVNVGGEMTDKVTALCDLIEVLNPRSAIVFCNTKSDTELVEVYLRRRGFNARLINSDLNQRQRDSIVQQVRTEKLRFLVATDIAARGIDIDHIEVVFNYSIPVEPDLYTHRSGRTGRAGRSGIAVNLVGPQDFSAFLALKRAGGFEFVDQALPSPEEVVSARAAHVQAVARSIVEGEPQPKERALAVTLLERLGSITDAKPELTDLVARLCRAALEHHALLMKSSSEAREEERGDSEFGGGDRERERRRDSRGREGGGRGGDRRGDRGSRGRGRRGR